MPTGLLYILLFYFVGTVISNFIGHFIPGSVIGMLLFFTALLLGVVKPERVKRASHVLTRHMSLFFIPAAVGVMASFDVISSNWAVIVAASTISTVLVIISVGYIQQKLSSGKDVK